MRTATFLIIVILLALSGLPSVQEAGAAPGDIQLISVATDGTHSDYDSAGGYGGSAAVSADGGYVAFASFATTLVPDDTNDTWDVFVRTVQSGVTERISVASDGRQATGASAFPAISADGQVVAFVSDAADLAPGGSGGRDVFVHDRQTGQTERIHVTGIAPDGSVVDGQALTSRAPSLSADGRYVAFGANLAYRAPDVFHFWPAMYVHDRASGTTELVSLADDDSAVGDASWPGTISADGRFVTFASTAAGVTPDKADGNWDYFVRDRQLGTTERVPITDPKQPPSADGGRVQIGGDGRFVAVWQPGVSHYAGQIPPGFWIYDRLRGTIDRHEQITDERTGVTGAHPSILTTSSSFSADGDSLAVGTDSGMFILDLASGAASLVTGGLTGGPVPGGLPVISDGGVRVVFEGDGVGLIPGYAPEWPHTDVFMLDRSGSLPRLPFAHDAFERTWARTDLPVFNGYVPRTWMWGPEPLTGAVREPYAEAPGGTRLVQYFDKSRMEITHPDAVDDGLWYVTNGLLARELISGQMQVGDASFVQRLPAEINVAGDQGFVNGPTYAALRPLASLSEILGAPDDLTTAPVTERVDATGIVTTDERLAAQGVRFAFYDTVTRRNIAAPFWEFMNARGMISGDGGFEEEVLFANPFYATGRPLTEAYWADIVVAGTEQLVLLQCFERRCLTYTPGNEPGWRVEAGNVGRHYATWRYAEPPDVAGQPLFRRVDEAGEYDLYTINADGTDEQNLTADFAPGVVEAVWSPDGGQIAFIAGDFNAGDLYVTSADGTDRRQIAADVDPAFASIDWSPDSSQIAFQRRVQPNETQIFVIGADGTGEYQLTNIPPQKLDGYTGDPIGHSRQPDWSPDGTQITFANQSVPVPATWESTIYVIDVDGSDLVGLDSGRAYGYREWSPDGSRILYSWVQTAGRELPGGSIHVVDVATGQATHVAGSDYSNPMWPAWSPDGVEIAVAMTPVIPSPTGGPLFGTGGLFLIDGATLARTQVTHAGWESSWSSDGQLLAYVIGSIEGRTSTAVAITTRDGRAQWLVTADGTAPQWRP